MPLESELVAQIQRLFSEKLLVEVESPEINLLETGSIDSVSLIQLLLHLEERFEVRLSLDELEIDDFSSIRALARLVARQKGIGAMAGNGD